MTSAPAPSRVALTPAVKFLVCAMASIGFAFDIYELLMMPLIIRPALMELTGALPGTPLFQDWVARLFYIPAVVGGVFGLLGGYLTDLLGRRRVLTWSILLYAFSAFAAGFSTSIGMLLFFRCTTFIGVCVEFVAAVAWLAELFTEPHQRERVLGYTQAFSSFGGLLVAVVNGYLVAHAASLPVISIPDWLNIFGGSVKEGHAAWRYTLMSGLIPAIPLIIIRPFLPESPIWREKKAAGTLKRPSLRELFAPKLRRTTLITTLMFAMAYGAAFGAIQQLSQIVPGVSEVRQASEGKPKPVQKQIEQAATANYTKAQEVGGLAGRFCLALLVVYIVSRRKLLRVFLVPGLILMPLIFLAFARGENQVLFNLFGFPFTYLHGAIFLAGFFTVAQFSFWGNYLPRVYPVHLRGTGESFAANIGGRMIGTSFAAVTSLLVKHDWVVGSSPAQKYAYGAALVGCVVYAVGLIASHWLPEPEIEGTTD